MGNSQSHTYADHQRDVWMRKSPQLASGGKPRRRTRSLVDEYLPDFGHTSTYNEPQGPEVHPEPSGKFRLGNQETHETPSKLPDPRFLNAPMPPSMNVTPAQLAVLRASTRNPASTIKPLQPNDHIEHGRSMPPPIICPKSRIVNNSARSGDTEPHIQFQQPPLKGSHDHSHGRPRTPYPKSDRPAPSFSFPPSFTR